jgi:isopenicillin N synthase-like dioxygenase
MEPINLCSTAPIYWAAPHTDIDYLTILAKAIEEGPQVEISGEWYDVKVKEDAFVINVKDMITNVANRLLKSSKHRVIGKKADAERFSIVFFLHPHRNTPLDPIQRCIDITGGKQIYGNGTQKEFL